MQDIKKQLIKFVVVGGINTAIDFTVLNSLILLFGLSNGDYKYTLYKTISFLVAVINSFALNKLWVFKAERLNTPEIKREIAGFISVSLVGLLINLAIASIVFHIGQTLNPSVSKTIWANVGALTGTILVLASNFFGYKKFVFKK